MFADVRRGLTVAAVVHGATVTDTDGNVIDTTEFFGPARSRPSRGSETAEAEAADETARRGDRRRRSDAVSERAPV